MIDIEQLRGQIQDVVALYRITAQVNCAKDTLLIVLNREPEQEVDYSQVVAALKDYLSEIKLQDEEIPERPVYGDRLLPPNYGMPKKINQDATSKAESGSTGDNINLIRVLGRISKNSKPEFEENFTTSSIKKAVPVEISPVEVTSEELQVKTIPIEETIRCPKCSSSQIAPFQKGFSWGKAVGGALLVGPLGLAAGGIGSKQVMIGCLRCGYKWQPK
jgi:hypothetical protein